MKFKKNSRRRIINVRKTIVITAIASAILLVAGVALIRKSYTDNLRPVNTSDPTAHVMTVEPNSTAAVIADTLKARGLIRSDWAFEWYVRNHQLFDELKAGTYIVYKDQSVEEIVDTIVEGKVETNLVTIIPGYRLDQVRAKLIESGFAEADVEAALKPDQWAGHPALTDKPKEASLEGYLYPESFQKISATTANDIVRLSLDEMKARLTPEIRQAISRQGLTLHQGVILASIIEREVSSPQDRAQVAQVFKKRLAQGMPLESNATDDYAKINPAYDTYKIAGLPPGPISNFTESSIEAVAFPAQTDWVFFVSGDDKRTHFSKTLQEHEALVEKYCTKACGR